MQDNSLQLERISSESIVMWMDCQLDGRDNVWLKVRAWNPKYLLEYGRPKVPVDKILVQSPERKILRSDPKLWTIRGKNFGVHETAKREDEYGSLIEREMHFHKCKPLCWSINEEIFSVRRSLHLGSVSGTMPAQINKGGCSISDCILPVREVIAV